MALVTGYHIHDRDDSIGHLENILIDDITWTIRYLIIDTKNWWPGRHVLIAPRSVTGISWENHSIRLDMSREQIEAGPPWKPLERINESYETPFRDHYAFA